MRDLFEQRIIDFKTSNGYYTTFHTSCQIPCFIAMITQMTTFADNRKAHFNYEILERFTAGIKLLGMEVKAVRKGQVSLDGSHVSIRGDEAYLIGVSITPLQPKNTPTDYEVRQNRQLLLNKKEIRELAESEKMRGLTIVPISMYNKGRYIKVEVAIVRGKKKFDKRETMKKRDSEREVQRTLTDKH